MCIHSYFCLTNPSILNLIIQQIIENSVIILFITDIDELVYSIISSIKPSWVEVFSLRDKSEDESQDVLAEKQDDEIDEPQSTKVLGSDIGCTGAPAVDEIHKIKQDMETLIESVKELQAENTELKKLLIQPPLTNATFGFI